ELSVADRKVLRALHLKRRDFLGAKTFESMPAVFYDSSVSSLAVCKRRLRVLAGFEPQLYDACINSCVCYAPDVYRERRDCPYCAEPRYDADGRPRSQFVYIPFTPRLLALLRNPHFAELLQYRARFSHTPDRMTDFFDSALYQNLLGRTVEVNGENLGHCYFSDPRDIALALSTDGFSPFETRKTT
ncbi:hypothetical protein BV20DRAFT_931425, partial [Pilatotrama ljubarskyi]